MRFYVLMALLFTMMGVGLYAIATRQTAGSLCRDTGRDIASLDTGVMGKFGRAIEDTCTR